MSLFRGGRNKTKAETPAMVAFTPHTVHKESPELGSRIFDVLKDCRACKAHMSSLPNTFRSMPFEAGSHHSG